MSINVKWKLEDDVNDYVKKQLESLGLKKLTDYNVESSMSDYMKEALKGSAKTKNKANYGKPDFHIEKYNIPVIIENKLNNKKHIAENKDGIKLDDKSVSNYAVNGAIYYAQNMIASEKYSEVVAIGISGDSSENVKISVYYVFGATVKPKFMKNYTELDFLENKTTFKSFYEDASLSDKEKHQILIDSQETLKKHAKNLNVLMNNHNIPVDQRVVYVSGMLLSMQDVVDSDGNKIDDGLIPADLKGTQHELKRDGVKVVNQVSVYLAQKEIPQEKRDLMLGSFRESISLDSDRDIPTDLDKQVSTLLNEKASVTKQVFMYIYENVFLSIDGTAGHLDIMGEMYSVFLKYALGDGKEIGIVLTPPYITKMMADILDVNMDSHVMDLATGSAGFLISSMESMIQHAEQKYGKKTSKAEAKIEEIKKNQLLGVELNAKMFTLASTNMILRGDGSSNIQKGSSFDRPKELYDKFKADKLLLNPPFTFEENGMPFLLHGLNNMKKGGRAAIIIQDSAGSGKAIKTNKDILGKHKMIASIKMPADTFMPAAAVQTSIYVFEAGTPHKFESDVVKFIDFRNDGYKRTTRKISELDNPIERYQDIVKIYRSGKNAIKNPEFHNSLWNLDEIYFEDFISDSGVDWNLEHHQLIGNVPDETDFINTVSEFISFEIGEILKGSVK
ncbi:SAM-dependent methyltransferase [Bacillus thuringiensis]|uniref:HsdM family class I SAM-dependent methyltransferase n=1 Tax=Bacillus thuringiensis TaxID=1428 RepID=UPI000BF54460|nr:N-6 DNA methylase [Bacillus thuringiensis]PFI25786.1 SAM-dependent methyltransferase [Bacillus thuringiensis]PFS51823.1 SAM-dependent methyltransferase [Bacillus thuringiensis]